eukprot:6032009-Pleurochrysis_carterae.AAC.2
MGLASAAALPCASVAMGSGQHVREELVVATHSLPSSRAEEAEVKKRVNTCAQERRGVRECERGRREGRHAKVIGETRLHAFLPLMKCACNRVRAHVLERACKLGNTE